jgi:hypothetical protein
VLTPLHKLLFINIGMRGVELRNKDIFSTVQPINSSISDDPEEGVSALALRHATVSGWCDKKRTGFNPIVNPRHL